VDAAGSDATLEAGVDSPVPREAGAGDASRDAAGDAAAADAGPPSLFEDTSDGIHAFLTFDYRVTDIAAAAAHDVYAWGNDQGHVAAYRASSNPKIVLSSYIPWTRDPDATHDLAYWNTQHPDWVVYACDRTTPVKEFTDPNLTLDISNPAVIAWQADSYGLPASQAGYDAIAADNFELSNAFGACGVFRGGQWVGLYSGPTDPKYTADALAWTALFRQKLQAFPRPLGLIPNFSLNGLAANDPSVVALVSHVDAILDEAGYTRYGQGPATGSEWLAIESFVTYVQGQGKGYFSINQQAGATVDRPAIQWALASYLMSKEHASGIYVSGQQGYGADNYTPEYSAAIGTPCGAMQPAAQGLYTRAFQHALAIVNPTTSAASFTLPSGAFTDLYGSPLTGNVPLAPTTGMVLLANPPRC
jgi:hypothetical protein